MLTPHRTTIGFCLAAIVSLALAATAFAGPTGDEYLPQVPQAGAGAPTGTATSGNSDRTSSNGKKDDSKQNAVPLAAGSGGSGGDSGSILLNPIVLLMIAAVIAAAVGATLWRRRSDEPLDPEGESAGQSEPERSGRTTAPTPDGEIIGPDQAG